MAFDDLILCKLYEAVSKPTVGTNQTVETVWVNIFEYYICLSWTEVFNGTFYKWTGKSMRDSFVCTIQPAMNVFIFIFAICNMKNMKISGIEGEEDIYDIALKGYEAPKGKSFPFQL